MDLNSEEHRNTAIDGDDEISALSSNINSMLDIILSSQREIEKKTEEIVKNEQYLSQLINSISAGVMIVDPETRTIEAINDFALRLSGFSREETLGSVCHGLVCFRERGGCPVLDMGQGMDMSRRELRTRDGKIIPIMKSASIIERKGRKVLLETFVDITEIEESQRRLEEAKAELEQKVAERTASLQGIIDTARSGIIVIDSDGAITEFSPAAQSIFGYARDEIIGKNISLLMPEPYSGEHDGYIRAFMNGGPEKAIGRQIELPAKRRNGKLSP